MTPTAARSTYACDAACDRLTSRWLVTTSPGRGGGDNDRERLAAHRFAEQRVARLATLRAGGPPHLVPVVFAVDGDVIWTAVDGKPKSTTALRRLRNIEGDPRVSLLVDHYDEDWTQLWWVRADGRARVVPSGSDEEQSGLDRLVARYIQYQSQPPLGPVVQVTVERWTSWTVR